MSGKRGELVFRTWSPGDKLVTTRHGVGEPEEGNPTVCPGLILVPLLAFDAAGHRLGYGGGYYDRVLRESGLIAVGIAYAGQEVQTLPREAHDRQLDFVVTEFGLRRFKSA
jgi:5-formyltetrahydrofolate cyclo-ligase